MISYIRGFYEISVLIFLFIRWLGDKITCERNVLRTYLKGNIIIIILNYLCLFERLIWISSSQYIIYNNTSKSVLHIKIYIPHFAKLSNIRWVTNNAWMQFLVSSSDMNIKMNSNCISQKTSFQCYIETTTFRVLVFRYLWRWCIKVHAA